MNYLIFVRHGDAELVPDGRLTLEGIRKIRILAAKLSPIIIGKTIAILTSSQIRGLHSGYVIADGSKISRSYVSDFAELWSQDTISPVDVPRARAVIQEFVDREVVIVVTHAEYCEELPSQYIEDDWQGRDEIMYGQLDKACALVIDFRQKIITKITPD